MKVPFHLKRTPQAEPSTAVLIETDRAEALLDLVARLGGDRWPTIHRVVGGYLVKLPKGVPAPVGPVRLRNLAENLFLPADADLIPALLDDEASGLTRDRGLLFLPGGRILEFDHASPVKASAVLVAGRTEARDWRPLPDRSKRPDRIVEILLDIAEGPSDDPTESSPDDPAGIGTEAPPRPKDADPASTIAARAAVGAGRGMIGLGAMLGFKGLAEMGARWIARAVEKAPRITESMLGKQEGALRELLRQFREGRIDEALRHAFPLGGGGQGSRGGTPATDATLPTVDPTYSLESLLGSGEGGGSIWFGGFDVQAELIKEYRRAAEEAEKKGDFRRAAYILGKLLGDHANAAHMLTRGGLHHDAAMLYLNRLEDLPAAARSFEAAGEVDRALQLYRQAQLHAEAGDLLRRMDEEEAAVEEYVVAADQIVGSFSAKGGWLEAGDLLRDRAIRPDLALNYYGFGWGDRPLIGAISCGLRMLAIHADRGDAGAMTRIVDEADRYFEVNRHLVGDQSPAFYNEIARLADLPTVAPIRDDLRDRALMGLAAWLRYEAANRPGALAGKLISGSIAASNAWSPDVVNDANLAVSASIIARRNPEPDAPKVQARSSKGRRIAVAGGTITAACHATSSGDVFLGFETGEVYRVDLGKGEVSILDRGQGVVESMAADPDGMSGYILRCEPMGSRRLTYRSAIVPSGLLSRQDRVIDGPGNYWLTPVLPNLVDRTVGVWIGDEMIVLGGPDGLGLIKRLGMPFLKNEPHAAILIPPDEPGFGLSVLIQDGPDACLVYPSTSELLHRRDLNWQPALPEQSTLRTAPMAWLQAEPDQLELAGLDDQGVIHWSSLKFTDAELIRSSNHSWGGPTRFLATTLIRPGMVAGVRAAGVDWLRCGPHRVSIVGTTDVPLPTALACFLNPRTNELAVVCGDGGVVCVPVPR